MNISVILRVITTKSLIRVTLKNTIDNSNRILNNVQIIHRMSEKRKR